MTPLATPHRKTGPILTRQVRVEEALLAHHRIVGHLVAHKPPHHVIERRLRSGARRSITPQLKVVTERTEEVILSRREVYARARLVRGGRDVAGRRGRVSVQVQATAVRTACS